MPNNESKPLLEPNEEAECNLRAALDALLDGNNVSAIKLAAVAIVRMAQLPKPYACPEHQESANQLDPMCPICLLKEINQLKAPSLAKQEFSQP